MDSVTLLRRRLERYGSCMANIVLLVDEIFYLQEEQLLPILSSLLEADTGSKIRVIHLVRYVHLNMRFIIEQIAFGMALANYDAVNNARLLNWSPREIVKTLRHANCKHFYPKPNNPATEYLREQDFLRFYGRLGDLLHSGNPLRMEAKESIVPEVTAPAKDAEKAVVQAREMNGRLMRVRNLLADHEVATSFDGCAPWRISMCNEEGHIEISTRWGGTVVGARQPSVVHTEKNSRFWRLGELP